MGASPLSLRPAVLVLAIAFCSACGSVPNREGIPPFKQAVLAADAQATGVFADVNAFLREQQVERAIRQQALSEELFFEALASADIAKWHRAFGLIESYADKLDRLLAPEGREGIEGELSTLSAQLSSTRDAHYPPGVSAAFMKLGGLIVQSGAEKDALGVMRRVDPAIQQVLRAMIEAIGEDPESGVRGTVRTSWAQVMARIDVIEFRAAGGDSAGKRRAALLYVKAMDARDQQDNSLNSLAMALSALAESHKELAVGNQLGARAMLDKVQSEYKAYRASAEAAARGAP